MDRGAWRAAVHGAAKELDKIYDKAAILYTYIYNRHNTPQYRQENMGYEPWKWH